MFRVRGGSMRPTLAPGDFVLVDSRSREQIQPEMLVVARVPTARDASKSVAVVKRVRSRGDASLYLGSDNPLEGRDSRHFGSVPLEQLIGEVVLHLELGKLRHRWRSINEQL